MSKITREEARSLCQKSTGHMAGPEHDSIVSLILSVQERIAQGCHSIAVRGQAFLLAGKIRDAYLSGEESMAVPDPEPPKEECEPFQEECGNCRNWRKVSADLSTFNECRQAPISQYKHADQWCGQWGEKR